MTGIFEQGKDSMRLRGKALRPQFQTLSYHHPEELAHTILHEVAFDLVQMLITHQTERIDILVLLDAHLLERVEKMATRSPETVKEVED